MAQVGDVLALPESGWARFDNTDTKINYEGNWSTGTNANDYNNTEHYSKTVGVKIKFRFFGRRLRVIGVKHTDSASNVEISIDGIVETFSFYGTSLTYKVLLYESHLAETAVHDVEITLKEPLMLRFDALDIDEGYLVSMLGSSLTSPDRSWRRYDDRYPSLVYSGTWGNDAVTNTYNTTGTYSTDLNAKLTFSFKGTKIRLIGYRATNKTTDGRISIDGVTETFSEYGSTLPQLLMYERTGLADVIHTVEVSLGNAQLYIDAIDIDDKGNLVSIQSPPSTGGVLRTRISDMGVGDYIRCGYAASSAAAGKFFGFGSMAEDAEIPRDGTTTPSGYFYFIKVKDGLLVADRVVQYGVSWLTLNTAGYTMGDIFNDSLIPVMANDTTPAFPVPPNGELAASAVYSTTYPAWKAADGVDDAWGWILPQKVQQGWLEYRFYSPTVVRKYHLRAPNTNPSIMPSSWAFEGWDGTNWIELDRQAYTGWVSTEERLYSVSNGRAFSKYRIVIDKNDGHATYTGIGEFRLGADPIKTTVRMLTGGIAYMRFDGYPTATDEGLGMFPADNEWDAVIKSSPWDGALWGYTNGAIESEWTQDTPFSGFTNVPSDFLNSGLGRTVRGRLGSPTEYWSTNGTYTTPAKIGFRPVLEYSYL